MHLAYGGHSTEYCDGYIGKRKIHEDRPVTRVGIFQQREEKKIARKHNALKAKFVAAEIKIDTNRPEYFTKIKRKDMSEVVDLNIKASFDIAQLATKVMSKSRHKAKSSGTPFVIF